MPGFDIFFIKIWYKQLISNKKQLSHSVKHPIVVCISFRVTICNWGVNKANKYGLTYLVYL